MQIITPDFYAQFHCIASACSHTCCAGWEIDVDDDTLSVYRNLPGELGERLRQELTTAEDGSSCFQLQSGDRCPFLNHKNLCNLITAVGDDRYLCHICREHPRFYEWYGDTEEAGLGLSCEEVCRLLFTSENPLRFVTEKNDDEPDPEDFTEPDVTATLLNAREQAFAVLRDRTVPFGARLVRVLKLAKETEDLLFPLYSTATPSAPVSPNSYRTAQDLLELFAQTEPIDDTWPKQIYALQSAWPTLWAQLNTSTFRDTDWERLTTYLLYRYWMKAVWDGRLTARVGFCAVNVWFLHLTALARQAETGTLTEADKIDLTRALSAQIEYSDDNVALLTDACETIKTLDLPAFSVLLTETFGGNAHESSNLTRNRPHSH